MNAMKIAIYVFSALFAASLIFVVLPWSTLNAFTGLFGPYAFPDTPIVQYTVKVSMVFFFWIGVLLAVTAAQPERHQVILLVLCLMFASATVFILAIGWVYDVPWFFYLDAVSSAALAALLWAYRSGAMKRPESAE